MTTAAAHERELADLRVANLRARQVITSLNLAAPQVEEITDRLLNEIDSLITMIRDLDEHTTRDDPAHDTELEAAQHKVSYLERALQNEMTARTLVLQRVARSVRNAYQKGYNAGHQQANH